MKKKILVGLLVLISCIFAFAAEGDNIDELTVTLEVAPFGPYAYFTDGIISNPSDDSLEKKLGKEKVLSPVGVVDSSGNWATGLIYATIITNQTGLTTTVEWTDLSNTNTTTYIPLSVTCSEYYVNGTKNIIGSAVSGSATGGEEGAPKEYSLSLPGENNDNIHGKRAVSYKLDMSVKETDYFAADVPTDDSNYQCKMTLYVSAS